MSRDKKTIGEFSKSARIVSDYANDLIFEQPRENLLKQEFISYEYSQHGLKKTTIYRKFSKDGDYNDTSSVEIIG
ncbi:hypothetical protein OAA05_01015 [bacterium]|nr:hypothetical protein [bacterium]